MTVQQLIDELKEVKDKSKPVFVYDIYTDEGHGLSSVSNDNEAFVLSYKTEEWI